MGRPLRCHLWQRENISTSDLNLESTFTILKTFEEESHSIRRLLQCKDCGQLYYYEFYEEIDWEAGNDPQYRTYTPVDTEAAAERLATLPPNERSLFSPRLQIDWPANARTPVVKWIGQ